MRTALQLLMDLMGGLSAWFGHQHRHLQSLAHVNGELRAIADQIASCRSPAGAPEHAALVADLLAVLDASEAVVQAAVGHLDTARERAQGTAVLAVGLAKRVREQAAQSPGTLLPDVLPPLLQALHPPDDASNCKPSDPSALCNLPLGR